MHGNKILVNKYNTAENTEVLN